MLDTGLAGSQLENNISISNVYIATCEFLERDEIVYMRIAAI